MAERFEILSRYNVYSAEELRGHIENGTFPEHPTWEDYIELVNLEDELNLLDSLAGRTNFSQTFSRWSG